jgi:hypothetical protein
MCCLIDLYIFLIVLLKDDVQKIKKLPPDVALLRPLVFTILVTHLLVKGVRLYALASVISIGP